MNGYIMESRKILESAIWKKPPLYFKVWHYLLLNAQFADNGDLKRGQLFTTYDKIRKACSYKVGYRTVTPTKKEIRDVFDWLRNPREGHSEGHSEGHDEGHSQEPMIVTTKVTHGMIISVVKYNDYQDPSYYERHSEGRSKTSAKGAVKDTTKVQRRSRQGHNTNNKDNKDNKDIYIRARKNKFDNFVQRDTDYDEIEKNLIAAQRGEHGKRIFTQTK